MVGGATATVSASDAKTRVIEGEVTFGPIGAGETVLSDDTLTIRHDRRYPFDHSVLQWQVVPHLECSDRSRCAQPYGIYNSVFDTVESGGTVPGALYAPIPATAALMTTGQVGLASVRGVKP